MFTLSLRPFVPLSLALLAFIAGGCGYNVSGGSDNRNEGGYHWNSLFREDVQTVAIPIFANKTFTRGIEFSLTEAVIKQLEGHAPYKVVPRERSDTILEGQITALTVGTITRDFQTNLPREQNVTLTMDLIWKDLRTGRILMERHGLQQQCVYHPTLGEGQFVGEQEAVERFAQQIVNEMQADW